ncbi:MAG: T9SS type A sorting domain-containing protein, partial [Flavobacteriales bacterium]|nr:T9SS type A sorting domain-containing protein [Flavobacteriales bacterium]MDW8411028.1 T9SS type A sorting domain-containing protein [Flavobacteriales bacterium]
NLPPELCIGETITLQASPAGGTFSGPGVSGNTLNTAGLQEGTITLSYFYTDNNCSDTAYAQVFIKNCTGWPPSDDFSQWILSPNPVWNSQLWLQGSLVDKLNFIRLTDIQGRAKPLRAIRLGNSIQMDLGAVPAGVYVLEIVTSQGTTHFQKLVILENH